LKENIINF